MAHRNARLTLHGRRLLVERIRVEGQAVAHVAKAMGISRQCAHRWVARFEAEGDAGLHDRSSRPHSMPTRTSAEVEARCSPLGSSIAAVRTGSGRSSVSPARTVRRILRRHGMPRLCELDPLTGTVIRASKTPLSAMSGPGQASWSTWTSRRSGASPTAAAGEPTAASGQTRRPEASADRFDYIHSLVDDHSRLAYSEIHADEKADTGAAFFTRPSTTSPPTASPHRTSHDRQPLELPRTQAVAAVIADLGARHKFIKPHCPWQNGKVERLQPHPADRMGLPAGVHHQRRTLRSPGTMARPLQPPTTPQRPRRPPADQPPVTNLTAEYT